ncbi:MAG: hypothetical protein HZA53_04360 [Planctomycetes bacterium]|nr:hypothetical protein [Planctomycetota bacterium]
MHLATLALVSVLGIAARPQEAADDGGRSDSTAMAGRGQSPRTPPIGGPVLELTPVELEHRSTAMPHWIPIRCVDACTLEPIAGAEVRMIDLSRLRTANGGNLDRHDVVDDQLPYGDAVRAALVVTRTDADGRALVPAYDRSLSAVVSSSGRWGRSPALASLRPDYNPPLILEGLGVRLARPWRCTVRVLDAHGGPAAGVTVALRGRPPWPERVHVVRRTVTDEHGIAMLALASTRPRDLFSTFADDRCEHAPATEWSVAADVLLRAPPSAAIETFGGSECAELVLRLPPTASVEVRLHGALAESAAEGGASIVAALDPDPVVAGVAARSDSSPAPERRAPPEPRTLTTAPPSWNFTPGAAFARNDNSLCADRRVVGPVRAPDTVLRLDHVGIGEEVNVFARAYRWGDSPPGSTTIRASTREGELTRAELELPWSRRVLAARVLLPDGAPLRDTEVEARVIAWDSERSGPLIETTAEIEPSGTELGGRTDRDGRVTFAGDPFWSEGPMELELRAKSGGRAIGRRWIRVPGRAGVGLQELGDCVLEELPLLVAGRVTESRGAHLEELVVRTDYLLHAEAEVAADGRFELRAWASEGVRRYWVGTRTSWFDTPFRAERGARDVQVAYASSGALLVAEDPEPGHTRVPRVELEPQFDLGVPFDGRGEQQPGAAALFRAVQPGNYRLRWRSALGQTLAVTPAITVGPKELVVVHPPDFGAFVRPARLSVRTSDGAPACGMFWVAAAARGLPPTPRAGWLGPVPDFEFWTDARKFSDGAIELDLVREELQLWIVEPRHRIARVAVRGNAEIVLEPGIDVRVRWASPIDVPAGFELRVQYLPAAGSELATYFRTWRGEDAAFDANGIATLRAPGPGAWFPYVYLHDRSKPLGWQSGTGERRELEVVEEGPNEVVLDPFCEPGLARAIATVRRAK